MSSIVAPLADVKVTQYQIPRHGLTPNSGADSKPLILYRSLFPKVSDKKSVTAYLASVNVIKPQWTYTMYPTSHFHSTCHEVVIILSGSALLLFGGDDNPGRVELEANKGDAIILPAGMAHKQIRELSLEVFEMLGCYELDAEHWDMCYGREEEGDVDKTIKKLKWFTKDPFYGENGPALNI